jgi:leucine-rich PPR motif-containing protein
MLQKKVMPENVTYRMLIDQHCKAQNMEEARQLFLEMQARDLVPTTITYKSLLHGYNIIGKRYEVFSLFEEMVAKGIEPGPPILN